MAINKATNQHVRYITPGQRPVVGTFGVGTIFVNFPDFQLGVVDPTLTPVDLLAVTKFSATASYAAGAIVVQAGDLYRAKAAIPAGAFNATLWDKWAVGSGGSLLSVNNLSDLSSVSTARVNLGLGALATKNTVAAASDVTGLGSLALLSTVPATSVTGLAPSATTDTTNAANISSGVLPVARLAGLGITGVVKSNGTSLSAAVAGTDYMSPNVTANITVGYTFNAADIGPLSSGVTALDPKRGNYQWYMNNGAHTLSFPTTSNYAIEVVIINGSAAGAVTFSGGSPLPGNDAFSTTVNKRYTLSVRRVGGLTYYALKAHQ